MKTMERKKYFLGLSFAVLAFTLFGVSGFAKSSAKQQPKPASAPEAAEDAPANGVEGTELPILPKQLIKVLSWDAKTETYQLESVAYPGEGKSFATPKGMVIGIHALRVSDLQARPESIVGAQFTTDAELPTMFPEEVEARAQKRSKPNRK